MKPLIYIALGALISITCTAIATTSAQERTMVERVRDGTDLLRCDLPSGNDYVDADKVIGFQDGTWLFVNGHSKSCHLVVRK